jgi:ABC-type glycerol-3-phosphate transport system substrate-binding protein
MKRLLAIILSVLMILGLATACNQESDGGGGGNQPPAQNVQTDDEGNLAGEVDVWSFTGELQVAAIAFAGRNPGVTLNYEFVSDQDGMYQSKLDTAIMTGQVPDVIALEAAFVRRYVELHGALLGIDDLRPAIADSRNYDMMTDVGIDFDGVLKALSWQATPGGVVYRRSLAREYLGTDDPAQIQDMMRDLAAFEALGARLKEESGGTVWLLSSVGEFTNPFYANRTVPWVVDNKLMICPSLTDLLEMGKRFTDLGYAGDIGSWGPDWGAAIRGEFKEAGSDDVQGVFCFFFSTWGVSWLIPDWANAAHTSGDWGLVAGPLPYSWGGTWCAVMNGSANQQIGKELVKFAATDVDHLSRWALGEYTNEVLREIDPSINEDISQGGGDFLVSRAANERVSPQASTDFLGGQNPYVIWAAIAENVNQDMLQAKNDDVQRFFQDALNMYMEGNFATTAEALEAFEADVRSFFPDLD